MKNLKNFLKKISKGTIKYTNPNKLDLKTIDIKIRKSVENINQSNWCKTLWSCQGHKHKKGEYTLPYLTFVVQSDKVDILLGFLFESLPLYNSQVFPVSPNHYFTLNKGFSDKSFIIISIHWSKTFLTKKSNSDFYLDLLHISKKIKGHK